MDLFPEAIIIASLSNSISILEILISIVELIVYVPSLKKSSSPGFKESIWACTQSVSSPNTGLISIL